MRRIETTLVVVIVFLMLSGVTANVACAGTAGTVTGIDTRTAPYGGGISTSTYVLGSTVYIYWSAVYPNQTTVDITVIGPDGSLVAQWLNQHQSASGTSVLSFNVTQRDYYDIVFSGQRNSVSRQIAGVSLYVLPESALGTLLSIVAGAAAVGTFTIVKRKK